MKSLNSYFSDNTKQSSKNQHILEDFQMQRKTNLFVFVIFIILIAQSINAQVIIKKSGVGEGGMFFLNELSAIISEKDGTIIVEHAMPTDQRPINYRDIDFKQGDEILMVNVNRVKLVKDLEKMYNELEVGETMKLGVRRGEEMFIVSFNKMDPEKLPKRKLMIRKGVPGGDEAGDESKVSSYQIKIDNADGKMKFLMGTGLILKEKENQVKIDKVIPEMVQELGEVDVKEGDVVVALNDKKIKSLAQVTKIYDEIKVSDEVQLVTIREKKEITVNFKKPETEGQFFIKEN